MLSSSTRNAVLRRLDSLRPKYNHINLDISMVENMGGLQGFMSLPSGITPGEWDCEPDFYEFEKEFSAGNAAVVAIWDEGGGEKVAARIVDDFSGLPRLNRLEKAFPRPGVKKR